ncbi:MAG: DNA repair protein RecN (Recombination protein N), partial [Flavobacteriales bacterium]
MLTKLSISNYALIAHVQVDFTSGLSVITGETGSGKSILLGALNLVLGERADLDALRIKTEKCIVEAHFNVREDFKDFFHSNDLDFESETIVRRELSPNGKSRAFINDTPVNLKLLKVFGDQMVDIHSQLETGKLRDKNFRFELLDSVASQLETVSVWRGKFDAMKSQETDLDKLKESALQSKRDLDYFRFQLDELLEVNLDELKQEALESEADLHRNAEGIAQAFGKVAYGLDESENAVLPSLKTLIDALDSIASVHLQSNELKERMQSTLIELQDISEEASNLRDGSEQDPQRLLEIEQVLDRIYALQNKHQLNTVDQLIHLRDSLDEKVNSIDSLDERIQALELKVEKEKEQLKKGALAFHKSRIKAGEKLQLEIQSHLTNMKMPHATMRFSLTLQDTLSRNGCSELELLFTANKGGNELPLEKAASGGELSRVMLALKAVISAYKALPTLILDEIDTGVSGDVAARMAEVMKYTSGSLQLMAISHLPQVA